MIKRKYYKKNGRWRWHNEAVGHPDVCQGCKHLVDTMNDKVFYQVRINGELMKRCWICKSCAEGSDPETARKCSNSNCICNVGYSDRDILSDLGEEFETIF